MKLLKSDLIQKRSEKYFKKLFNSNSSLAKNLIYADDSYNYDMLVNNKDIYKYKLFTFGYTCEDDYVIKSNKTFIKIDIYDYNDFTQLLFNFENNVNGFSCGVTYENILTSDGTLFFKQHVHNIRIDDIPYPLGATYPLNNMISFNIANDDRDFNISYTYKRICKYFISFKEIYNEYPTKRQELINIINKYTYIDVNEYFNM